MKAHKHLFGEVLIRLSLFLWKTQEGDWLELRTPFLKVESTGIVIIVEKGFKFLLLEIVKENIQFINSYSLKLILF